VGLAVFAGLVLLVAPAKDGYGPARMVVLAVLGGTAFLLAILLARPLRRVLGLGRLARVLPFQRLQAEVRAALHLYRRHAAALGVALAVSLVNHGAAAFGVYLLGRALGIQGLEVGTTLALVPVANLFAAIPLVPGGWGVGELAFAWLFGQVGIAPTEAVGLSVVSRFAAVASSLPGGVMWIVWKERPTQAAIAETVEAAEEQVEAAEADPAPAPP
jgi:uncharacterized membrane protein YbhN (UPF0104 family)